MTAAYGRPLIFKGLQMAQGEGGFFSSRRSCLHTEIDRVCRTSYHYCRPKIAM